MSEAKLKSYLLYPIADALGLTLEYDDKTSKLTGATQRDVMFGTLSLPVDIKVVSSLLTTDQYMVMCKVMGNLGMLVASHRDTLELHLLNQSKLDSFKGWLEKTKPKDKAEAVKRLGAAVVKSYVKRTKDKWESLA